MKNIKKLAGYSLIELMITIAIGSFIILGAAYAFEEARKTYTVNDSVARLYEQAQFAVDILEEDIRLSNYWGLHNQRSAVLGDSNDPTVPVATVVTGDCPNAWALDLRLGISGSNNVAPPWAAGSTCADDYLVNTDTLVVRHANTDIIPAGNLDDGQLYIHSDETAPIGQLFMGNGGIPAAVGTNAQSFEYVAHGYFVAANSTDGADGIPTLMREALVDGGNGNRPRVETQEIIRGVEDFQLQFGVDFDAKGTPGYGIIDRYVNPDAASINNPAIATATRVLAVRFWLMLRSETPENGYVNENIYTYNTDGLQPDNQPNDNFRRLLVSKTVQIRNMTSN